MQRDNFGERINLGGGSYGCVYLIAGQFAAKAALPDTSAARCLKTEADMGARLRHSAHVTPVLGWMDQPGAHGKALIMAYAPNGTLLDRLA